MSAEKPPIDREALRAWSARCCATPCPTRVREKVAAQAADAAAPKTERRAASAPAESEEISITSEAISIASSSGC